MAAGSWLGEDQEEYWAAADWMEAFQGGFWAKVNWWVGVPEEGQAGWDLMEAILEEFQVEEVRDEAGARALGAALEPEVAPGSVVELVLEVAPA